MRKANGFREAWRGVRAGARRPGMLRRIVRTGLLCLLALAVLVPAVYVAGLPREKADTVAVNGTRPGESDAHSLAIDKATGAVSVTTGEGAVWRSNPTPDEAAADTLAKGVYKMTMLSQLVIRYVDEDNRSYTATTYANALDSGRRAPDITGGGDAYRVTYRFPTGKAAENRYLSVAVEYALLNGYLQVRVPFDGIEENDRFKLVDISLLPYFGAGSPEDEGYFLLPDGNGAAIDFNTPRTGAVEYAAEVYGRDPSLKQQQKGAVAQPVSLPFLGIRRGQDALLAIAAEGGELATIKAAASGMSTQWNSAYFTFRYRETDNITLNEMSWSERVLPYLGEVNGDVEAFTVLYSFLPRGQADEAGMAAAGRRYLMQAYGMEAPETGSAPLYIDLYMCVERTKAMLGLPYSGTEVLTSFDQAIRLLDEIRSVHQGGVVVRLNAWRANENRGMVSDRLDAEDAIGGKKGLDALIRYAQEHEDVVLCPAADFTRAQKSGGSFLALFQAARNVSGSIAEAADFLPSTKTKNTLQDPGYYLNPAYSRNLLERFAARLKKRSGSPRVGIAVDGYGSLLYADAHTSVFDRLFARQASDRAGSAAQWQAGLRRAGESFERVLLDGAAAYALPFATDVTGIPLTSSRYTIFTREVPFLQMVLSGMTAAAGEPVNMAEDPETYLLQCLQGGTAPLFAFTAEETSRLKNSRLDDLYDTQYAQWAADLPALLENYQKTAAAVRGRAITGWREENGQIVTTFEGGARLLIDYENKTAVLQ